jgi:RNA polymerase sigma-70 factor, ECF subfamily
MATLQAFASHIRPRAGVLQRLAKVRRERPRGIDARASRRLNSAETAASPRLGEEWTIVQQAIAGNTDAQQRLFARYSGRLYRTAFAILRNREDAQDAVQDGLCKAYTGLRSFQGRSSFSTWLTRVVINASLMIRRKKSLHPEASLDEILDSQLERLPPGAVDARPNPEKLCAAVEIRALVDERVRRLPPLLRAAFRLRATDSLSIRESSCALGIPESAFKSRISRAIRKLASGLQQSR